MWHRDTKWADAVGKVLTMDLSPHCGPPCWGPKGSDVTEQLSTHTCTHTHTHTHTHITSIAMLSYEQSQPKGLCQALWIICHSHVLSQTEGIDKGLQVGGPGWDALTRQPAATATWEAQPLHSRCQLLLISSYTFNLLLLPQQGGFLLLVGFFFFSPIKKFSV